MPAVTIRNLSVETHRALKRRAKLRGSSTEGEIRAILEEAVRPAERVKIGSELAKFAQKLESDLKIIRDPRSTDSAAFD